MIRVIDPGLYERVDEIVFIGLAFRVYELVSMLTMIADEIVSIGLAFIVYEIVSMLTMIADEIVSMLTMIADEIVSSFDIYSKVKLSCTWIDTCLRNPYEVGHLLHPHPTANPPPLPELVSSCSILSPIIAKGSGAVLLNSVPLSPSSHIFTIKSMKSFPDSPKQI